VTNSKSITVTLLRHGEVDGQAHVLRGESDEGLTLHGIEQMQQVILRCEPFDCVVTSPLLRCQTFAKTYSHQQGLPLQVLSCFEELDFGDWEGLTPAQAAALNPNEYALFRQSNGVSAPPNGETLGEFRKRIAQGWDNWMQQDMGARRLLITHAGVMRGLLMELFGFSPVQAFQVSLPEAASLRISHLHGHRPFLLSLN